MNERGQGPGVCMCVGGEGVVGRRRRRGSGAGAAGWDGGVMVVSTKSPPNVFAGNLGKDFGAARKQAVFCHPNDQPMKRFLAAFLMKSHSLYF